MHPEIKSYFEKFGAIHYTYGLSNGYLSKFWQNHDGYMEIATKLMDGWHYKINNKWYPESDALKIIKLIAWL
jgi:hypothetical protein